ncbi:MAG: apolipoprotein N-acyltransferase [Porticoccaceae bacterium]
MPNHWSRQRSAIALVAGALTPLSLAPLSWWPIAALSAAVLCLLLRGSRPRRAFGLACWFGFGLFATGASWVYVSIHQYGEASAALAGSLTLAFVAVLAAIFALPFAIYGRLDTRNPAVAMLAFPALWVLGEWWRGWVLTGFPWLYLGYGHLDTWLAGWAPVGGVLGISGLVAYGGAFVGAVAGMVLDRKFSLTTLGVGLVALSLIWVGGGYLQSRAWTAPDPDNALSVALVQPAEPQATRWSPRALPDILANFSATTGRLWNHDLIVWPESGIPRIQRHVQSYLDALAAEATRHHSGLITGIPTEPAHHRYFNSAIALGTAQGIYHKRHLVPFGEYVPLESWLRGTIAFLDLPMSTFSSGPVKQPPITLGSIKIATAICYEVVYHDLVAADAGDANLLLTLSNDTWFGDSLGPHQHLEMARMRALENGKPMLRATNDGITAVIDAQGRISGRLPQFSAGVLEDRVIPHRGATPFSNWGSRPTIALSLLLYLSALWLSRQRHSQPSG